MSLESLICMEWYYFHVYVVPFDVHFRYSDDAFTGMDKTSLGNSSMTLFSMEGGCPRQPTVLQY